MIIKTCLSLLLTGSILFAIGCADLGDQEGAQKPTIQATPANTFTTVDVAKLKWIEGTWRGMDGDKPFYERYHVYDDAVVVETLEDGNPARVKDTDRFELKNGEFGQGVGDKRSAASEIGDGFVQFVPAVAGKGNSFRFVRKTDGTWQAQLEWPAKAEKPAQTKVYKIEQWPVKEH